MQEKQRKDAYEAEKAHITQQKLTFTEAKKEEELHAVAQAAELTQANKKAKV